MAGNKFILITFELVCHGFLLTIRAKPGSGIPGGGGAQGHIFKDATPTWRCHYLSHLLPPSGIVLGPQEAANEIPSLHKAKNGRFWKQLFLACRGPSKV